MRIPRPQRSQLAVGALVVAALATGQALHTYLPESDRDRPFRTEASADGVHHLRFGDLKVTKVAGSRQVKGSFVTDPMARTDGVFVVVTFRWTPRLSSSDFSPSISYGELHDGHGRLTTFSGSGDRSRIDCTTGPLTVAAICVAVVEADPTTLPGSSLVLGSSPLDERFDSVADIDLDLTAAQVRTWWAADRITLPVSGVKVS